jgi:hypothetical protein
MIKTMAGAGNELHQLTAFDVQCNMVEGVAGGKSDVTVLEDREAYKIAA